MNLLHLSSGRPLGPARLAAHHAAQAVSAFAFKSLGPHPEHHHSALRWDSYNRAIVGESVGVWQAGLRLQDLTWILLTNGNLHGELAAEGRTLAEGMAWMADSTVKSLGARTLEPRGYELPLHAAASGGRFALPDEASLAALTTWFDAGFWAIQSLLQGRGDTPDIRVWPHHFDLAHLLQPWGASDPDKRSVGVGMSPGDGGSDTPYFYVTPWPAPAEADLPTLPHGAWVTEGWTGARLGAEDLVGKDPTAVMPSFLETAVAAAEGLLGG